MTRTNDERKLMRTQPYLLALRQCLTWKDGPGVWVALHRGSRIRGYGSTRAKARTNCVLAVFAAGWEE